MPTKIPWTDETWQPVVGCTKVSEGCQNCYAEKMAMRLAAMGQTSYQAVIKNGKWLGDCFRNHNALEIPLHWKKPRRIFVCSMGDLFHESVPFEFIGKVFDVIQKCPQHTFQILTKRPEIAYDFFGGTSGMGLSAPPLSNLWLGVTIELPKYKHRAEILSRIPAAVRFISFEPLLGDMGELLLTSCREDDTELDEFGQHIDWGIIGCESINGKVGRLPEGACGFLSAARKIIKQCKAASVPVFVKQIPLNGKVSKDMSEWPKDLQLREMPMVGL